MISNIPSEEDFFHRGLVLLNYAWEEIIDVQNYLDYAHEFSWNDDELFGIINPRIQKPLSIAQALAQQGAELVLKSVIARESPFLLIKDQPKDWPRLGKNNQVDFSDFRTIDAQDLIAVCKTIGGALVPDGLIQKFEINRKIRNASFHTIDNRIQISVLELLRYIIEVLHFVRPYWWPIFRNKFIDESHESVFDDSGFSSNLLTKEFLIVIELLGNMELEKYFSFNKKNRRYACPNCYSKWCHDVDSIEGKTAILKPNSKSSTKVFCFVCMTTCFVKREACKESNCKGNVLSLEDVCMSCGDYPD